MISDVRALNFGVYMLWEQLKQQYSCILLVSAFSKGCPEWSKEILLKQDECQRVYGSLIDTIAKCPIPLQRMTDIMKGVLL